MTGLVSFLTLISAWAIPLVLVIIPAHAIWKEIDVYEEFVQGAKEGFITSLRLIPYLVAIMVAITVFTESGGMNLFTMAASSLARILRIPAEVIPLALMRPLSGTGALGMLASILKEKGPDSYIGVLASTMMGSTETTLYIITVYYGAVGINRPRYSLIIGLAADLAGFISAVLITNLLFPHL